MADTETVTCCDNGDVQLRLELVDEPGCSMLAVRIAGWDERDEDTAQPGETWDADDHAGLDLGDMRRLHGRLGELIAQVEAHDAALTADENTEDTEDGM